MATAIKIGLKTSGANKNTARNFLKFEANNPVNLIDGINWFQLDADIAGFTLAYLYLVTNAGVDLDFEIYRSPDIDSLDTKYAVPIPGGSSTLPAVDTTADFSISLFGGETLWLKVDATGITAPNNMIEELYLMIKR